MEILGKATINPILYYSGKISGYLLWIILGLLLLNISIFNLPSPFPQLKIVSISILCIGLFITGISLLNLGKSTRLGLPSKETKFKKNGIYNYSRNPMYIGFGLITIASMVYTSNIIIVLLGLYSIYVYHLIILNEENFLEKRFGNEYLEYKKKVRRYI